MRTLLALLLSLLAGCGKSDAPGGGEPPAPVEAKYTPIAADDLATEWAKNPAAAADRYKVNGVELTGTLREIQPSVIGSVAEVRGASGDWRRAAQVKVEAPAALEGLKRCEVGKSIIVRGRTDGTTGTRPWVVADEIRPGD
jgi:hypothetical protein